MRRNFFYSACLLVLLGAGAARAADDVFEMDVRTLMQMDVEVTSPSKHAQPLRNAASAIYVVTQEDVRRTGATNIMEALRIVPGLLVSRLNANQYAISARGFNRQYGSNKLLVLMDGRTIYNPSFSGTIWVAQDTVMEDIERIEVIRGPGAALWGSNAVAGVINIITKSAAQTQGALASGGAGTRDPGFGTVRYGDKIGENFNYRVYGKYQDRGPGARDDGSDAFDSKQMTQGGFRSDWQANRKDLFTFQGDFYHAKAETDMQSRFVNFTAPFNYPYRGITDYSGGNFLSRWTHNVSDTSSFKLQTYYDRINMESDQPTAAFTDQFDVELQHDFALGDRNNVLWGASFRKTAYNVHENIALDFPNQERDLFGFFVHDELALIPKTWTLITGAKFEHNEFTGWEIQPNIRTVWTPHQDHTFWGAVSRAVRLPNPSENGLNAVTAGIVTGGPVDMVVRILGNPNIKAETLLAFEGGYRAQVLKNLSFDVTGYAFQYDRLIDLTQGSVGFESTPRPAHLVMPTPFGNALRGEVYGTEVSANWRPFSFWSLASAYTFVQVDLRKKLQNAIEQSMSAEREPEHIFNARSYLKLPYHLEFDTMAYYVAVNPTRDLPSYTRWDLRLGWQPRKWLEFSILGENLQQARHAEFNNQQELQSNVPRRMIGKATFRF
jgi:iron complex outermembrane receptor protein